MKYFVSGKDNELSNEIKNQVIEEMNKHNFEFNEENPDIVIFVGGDGAFLKAVRKYMDNIESVKFVGIKTGNLGFFCDYQKDEVEQLVSNIANGVELEYQYNLLEATINYGNSPAECVYAVNEIRIENPFKTLVTDIYINNTSFEEFRGSGLIVSSTLGSTAFNKSCGGACIDSNLNLLQLTEINGINNHNFRSLNSSLVLKETSTITFKGDFINTVIAYDNEIINDTKDIERIDVRSSDIMVTLLRFKPYNYIEKLKHSFID